MTNNTPDYKDNLYFEEKMDCKNCPYTDEYCASGDCERNTGVCKTLTEQWKKGELEVGKEYWVILTNEWYLQRPVAPVRAFYSCDHEFEGYYDNDIKEVLAPVPSYEEYEQLENWSRFTVDYHALREAKEIAEYEKVELLEKVNKLLDDNKRLKHDVGNLGYKIKNQRKEIERQIAQNAKLKELLKRVNEHFKWVDKDDPFYVEDELWDDIKKVLEKKNEMLK